MTNVVNVEGGTLACEAAGLPLVRGKKTISLERQVRIAAGRWSWSVRYSVSCSIRYWIGLSAFVGAGLLFAGLTDTCGMGMCLAACRGTRSSIHLPSSAAQQPAAPSECPPTPVVALAVARLRSADRGYCHRSHVPVALPAPAERGTRTTGRRTCRPAHAPPPHQIYPSPLGSLPCNSNNTISAVSRTLRI